MASSLYFHLAVALLLVLVHQQAAGEPDTFDLEKVVERFVEREAKEIKRDVFWLDFHRDHHEAKEYGEGHPPVTAKAGSVVYGATKSSAKRPNVVYTQWVHNGQASSSQKTTIERKTEHKKTASWHVEAGFSYSGSVKASASIWKIVNIETEHKISLDLKGGYREEVSDTETFSVNQVVTVPPMKSVKIDWIITDAVQELPWTSTVTVTGDFAVKYTDGSIPWFYKLHFLQDSRLKDIGNDTYLYTAKGTFMGVEAHEAHLRVTEHDFQPYEGRSSAVRTYTIPLSLAPHTPAAKALQYFRSSTSEENTYHYFGINFLNIVASVLRVTGLWS
uniref:Putative salivary secreted peptide n=1 Tax=Ixodes scapularis TaxID=6945 RepID=A0A4D5RPZ6_IXOSC